MLQYFLLLWDWINLARNERIELEIFIIFYIYTNFLYIKII